MKKLLSAFIVSLNLVCTPTVKAQIDFAADKQLYGQSGLALEHIDPSVRAQDDFYHYANGTWIKQAEFPEGKSEVGIVIEAYDLSISRRNNILKRLASTPTPAGSDRDKAKRFLNTMLDKDFYESHDLSFIKDDLNFIDAAKTHSEFAHILGVLQAHDGVVTTQYVNIAKDRRNDEAAAVYLNNTSLHLERYGDYWSDSDVAVDKREKYHDLIVAIFEAIEKDNAAQRAENIMAYETGVARILSRYNKTKPLKKRYNPVKFSRLKTQYKGFDWDQYFSAYGLEQDGVLIIEDKKRAKAVAKHFGQTDLQTLKDISILRWLLNYSDYLPNVIKEPYKDYRALRYGPNERSRTDIAYARTTLFFSDIIAQDYTALYSSQDSHDIVKKMIANVSDVFSDNIKTNAWMDEETRAEALIKLAAIKHNIGHPKVWEDYANYDVDDTYALRTRRAIRTVKWKERLQRLKDGPKDKPQWRSAAYDVYASYAPHRNDITITDGFLQPPLFDKSADLAVIYGKMGVVIGHELGHAFDNEGRQRDAKGGDRNWWSENSAKRFKARSERLARQFDDYEVFPGETLNGWKVLGENIGDLTGVKMAYEAYKRSLDGKEAPIIDGFTGDQRFFLSYAQFWRSNHRPKRKRLIFETDVHSPSEYRTNGILRNFGPWYDAFNVTESDALYLKPEDRVSIW